MPLRRLPGVGLLALAVLTGCSDPPPAPYRPPAPGTTYFYSALLANRIVSNDGWRTRYVDGFGRPGSRLALFIPERAQEPVAIDSAALAVLWPLAVGRRAAVQFRRGDTTEHWRFRIDRHDMLSVPLGQFMAFEVLATQVVVPPDRADSIVTSYTWYYAPEVDAVVRFRANRLAGPGAGQRAAADLEEIIAPQDTAGFRRAVARRVAAARRADSAASTQKAGGR